MKKTLTALFLLGALISVQAAAPTYATDGVVYDWYDSSWTEGADTLVAATDSFDILSNVNIDPGWEYILVRNAFTGDGSDSVKVAVNVRCENDTGGFIYSVAVDSFTASAGEAVALDVGGQVYGDQFDVRLNSYTDNGGEVILPTKWMLVKRRAINLTRKR